MANYQWIIDFEERNGTDCVHVDATLYYANGARRDANNPNGMWADPPEDDLQRWSRQVIYLDTMYEIAVDEFRSLKSSLNAVIADGFGPSDADFDKLTELRKSVRTWRRKYRHMKKQIHDHPTNATQRDAAASSQKRKARDSERLAKIEI